MEIDYFELFWQMKLIDLKYGLACLAVAGIILLIVWLIEKWRGRK